MAPEVVDAWRADIAVLSDVLTRSFYDDPVMSWLCPEEDRRSAVLTALFRADLASVAKRGRLVTTVGRTGAAAWAAPDQWKTPAYDMMRVAAPLARSIRGRIRTGLGLFNRLERLHPVEPHWYLAVVGTDPAKQGQGVGGALIREITDRCDTEGMGAFLESSKEANVAYYERFGFRVTGEIRYGDSPTLWPMWRDPA